MKIRTWILTLLGIGALATPARADPAAIEASIAQASNPIGPASAGIAMPGRVTGADRNIALTAYDGLRLSFERNQGQADPSVRFLLRGDGYTLFLTAGEAVLALRRGATRPADPEFGRQPGGAAPGLVETSVVRMTVLDANPAPRTEGLEELPGKSNYFVGNNPQRWHTDVPRYGRIRYKDVYPGIDLIFYGSQRRLEYDFIVAPGADPGMIHLAFDGADSLRIDDTGSLVLAVPGGDLIQHAPKVYQESADARRHVPGRYVLEGGNRVAFRVADYDRGASLVIDPVLSYSTYLGGTDLDVGRAVAADSFGNVYVAGQAWSTDFPVTPEAYQGSHGGGTTDIFVAKLDPDAAGAASLLYSTYMGGSASDGIEDIAVDGSGNIYLTGGTSSADFPTQNAFQALYGGGLADAYVAKLDPTGGAAGLLYSTYLGGTDHDAASGIALDDAGNVYLAGGTGSGNFPTTPGAYQGSNGGDRDVFLAKLNPAGAGAASLLYSSYIGGSITDSGRDIALDGLGNVYITGSTLSTDFPKMNAYQANYGGGIADAFVIKFGPTAQGPGLLYSTYLGGSDADQGEGIAVGGNGTVYVTGDTASTNFPVQNAYQGSYGGGSQDAFVASLDPGAVGAASLLYSTYLGGTDGDVSGGGIALDGTGTVYVAGETLSTNFPTKDAFQGTFGGVCDAYVTRLDPTAGTAGLLYSTYLGGSACDFSEYVASDGRGNIYVTGYTESTDFPLLNAYQGSHGGLSDAFVAKLSSPAALDLAVSGACPGDITVDITGASPNGLVAIASAKSQGTYTVGTGSCAGMVVDLDAPALAATIGADANGLISLTATVKNATCGRFVQAADLTTCQPSNLAQVP